MISDALIATLVHGLYSWFLFNRVPRRRRWAAWLLVSSTMILSAGQLACCIMAAIGYAQSGPLALTAHDVHLIRTMFRVWLIITVCADSLICECIRRFGRGANSEVVSFLAGIGSFWTHRLWRRRATTLQWDEHSHRKPMSLVASLAQALIWVVLPGNVLSFVCTALALTLECIAEDRDTYSWILICLSKLHGLGIMVCLNMRDRTDSYIARSSGSSNRQPLKPLFITKEQYSPPSILIKPRAHLQDGECEEGRCQATRWSASPGAAQQASPMYPIRSSHNTAMRLEKEPTPGQRTLSIYSKQRFPLESVTPCKPPSFARHEFDTDSERERTGVEECGRTSADSDVTLTGAVNYFGGSNREWSSFGVKDRYKDLRSVSWQHPDDPEESEDGKLARHPQALLGKGSVMESSVAHAVPMMPVLAPSVTSPEHSLIQGEYHPGTPYWLTEACSTGSGRTGYLLHRQEAVATGRDSSSLGNLSPRTRLYRGAETTRS